MESFVSEIFVEVLLDQNLGKPLDYSVPKSILGPLEIGMRVEVPLKSTLKKGTISKIKSHSTWSQVKPIAKILSAQGEISPSLWKLAEWISFYYSAPLQKVLKLFVPTNIRKEVKEKTQTFLKIAKTHAECIEAIEKLRLKAPIQAEALETILNSDKGIFFTELKTPKSAITSLLKKKLIASQNITLNDDLFLDEEFFPTLPKKLNIEQSSCLEKIKTSLESNKFSSHLIFGVTGSGKTEVYMQAIQLALNQNKSAIMLVPEISLTSQTIERFKTPSK